MNINIISFIKMLLFLTPMAILRQYVHLIRSFTTVVFEQCSGSNSCLTDICHKKNAIWDEDLNGLRNKCSLHSIEIPHMFWVILKAFTESLYFLTPLTNQWQAYYVATITYYLKIVPFKTRNCATT